RQLLPKLTWPVRVAFTRQLGALGETVPVITQVNIKHQSDKAFLVTITGSNFTAQTQVVLYGHPKGTILSQSATQIVAVFTQEEWTSGPHPVGVLNAHGTAAQALPQDQNDGGGNGHKPTPGPSTTPHRGNDKTPTPGSTGSGE